MDEMRNLIGGEWLPATGGETFANLDPAHRGRELGRFPASTPDDLRRAVDAAAAAFPAWRRTPLAERQARVQAFVDALSVAREEIAVILSRENGKTLREARGEVDAALKEGVHYLRQSATLAGPRLPAPGDGLTAWMQYEALGVVGLITPWNYPLNVMCRKALPALLTGNTVVAKPASFTPWSGLALARLFERAGFPVGTVNCVCGAGSALGNALIDDPRVRALSFTGSTAVGQTIQGRAGPRLLRTQLELGGKNALIIRADADLEAAVAAAMTAGFACAGQWCTSTSRVLVERPVYEQVVTMLAERCAAMVVGDPLDEATVMGPVAGEGQHRTITAAIARAAEQGARQVAGGPASEAGWFVLPTVFADVTPTMDIFRTEIFGPVLAVTPFDGLDEGLALANDSCYGLTSALFTRDLGSALHYIDAIEAGMAHVNIHSGFKDPGLPFGGWKESGYGPPENGRQGFEFFTECKSVYVRA